MTQNIANLSTSKKNIFFESFLNLSHHTAKHSEEKDETGEKHGTFDIRFI
jgi:hypothetical protein